MSTGIRKNAAMTVDAARAKRSTVTRGHLVAVARKLFAERGFAGTSTEELVQRAGVTRGALYYHFRDKQAVFRAVFEQVEEEVHQRVNAVAMAEPDPWDALVAGCGAMVDAWLRPAVQRIGLVDAPAVLGWQEWRDVAAVHSFGLLVFGLESAMVTGEIVDQPVAPLAHMLLGALNEGALYIARADDRDGARAAVVAAVGRLLAGLRPPA